MIHIFDGAMGTMLQAGGLKPGAAPELMNVEAPEVVKSVHPALDKEALRIVKLMPRWIPGEQNGVTVRVKYIIPIPFSVKKMEEVLTV